MVNNVLNAEEKDNELLQEFISQVTSENSKLKYNVFLSFNRVSKDKKWHVWDATAKRCKQFNHWR